MANSVFGAQAHLSTTQQLVSSSIDPKKQTCAISKHMHTLFSKPNIFSCQNGKIFFTVQPRLTMSHPSRISLSYQRIAHGTQSRSLLVHQKMALETSCCTTAHSFCYHTL